MTTFADMIPKESGKAAKQVAESADDNWNRIVLFSPVRIIICKQEEI